MDTVSQIKEILQNDLQGFEYCLNNKGAWSTPDGIKDLIIGMIETKSALQKYLTEFETAINARTQPTPDSFPDGWETEWQPSFDAATPEPKPAQEMTANDFQLLEGEAGELLRQPATPENIARVAEIDAILAGDEAQELRLKQAFDEAALAYYSFGVELALKQKLAASAVFDKPFDEAELNRKAKEAYFMMIDLDEKREEFFDAFGKYYQTIFLQRYKYAPPVFNITTFNNNNGVIEWRK